MAKLAILAGLCSMGCFSRIKPVSYTRYEQVDPEIRREAKGQTLEAGIEEGSSRGVLSFEVVANKKCKVTTLPRYRPIRVEGYTGEGIPASIVYGAIAIPVGAATIPLLASQGQQLPDEVGQALVIGSLILGITGLVALPKGIYHAVKVGTEEVPGELQYGIAPVTGDPGSSNPSPSNGAPRSPSYSSSVPVARAVTSGERKKKGLAPLNPGVETWEGVCERVPDEGRKLGMLLKEETGRERIVPLGTTNASGTLRVNVLKALEKTYEDWPDAPARVEKTAWIVTMGSPSVKVTSFELGAHDALRYAEHARILENRRLARLAEERRRAEEQKRHEEEARRRGTRDDPALDPRLKAALDLVARWMFACAWPTADFKYYQVKDPTVQPTRAPFGLKFTVPVRLFGRTTIRRRTLGQPERDTWVDLDVNMTVHAQRDKILKFELEFSDYDHGMFLPPGTTAHAVLSILEAPQTVCPKWSP